LLTNWVDNRVTVDRVTVDQGQFRAAMSRLATGVTVLSTLGDARHEVMTANAVTSVSLEPMLLLVSIRRGARWLDAARSSGRFAVNVLAAHHEGLARWCADRARHNRPDVVTRQGTRVSPRSGLLLLDEALLAVECSVHSECPAGDHVVMFGEVEALHVPDNGGEPLVFFDHRYATVQARAALLSRDGLGAFGAVRPDSVYPAVPEVPAVAASG
jgi:flavin reductase